MLDHILCYPTADDRPIGPLGDDGAPLNYPSWDDELGRVWMPVRCIVREAELDDAGEIVTDAIEAPGAWMVVRSVVLQADIADDPRCLIISDSDLAAAGQPFVLACKLLPDTLLGRIEPVFAGDSYPFLSGPTRNLEPLMVVN